MGEMLSETARTLLSSTVEEFAAETWPSSLNLMAELVLTIEQHQLMLMKLIGQQDACLSRNPLDVESHTPQRKSQKMKLLRVITCCVDMRRIVL